MDIGIGASSGAQATIDRCKQLGVERVFINCASLPGYQENGYPDAAALRAFKGRLEEGGIQVPSATYWFAKWPARPTGISDFGFRISGLGTGPGGADPSSSGIPKSDIRNPKSSAGSTNPDVLLSRDRRCIDAMLRMIELLGEAGITSVLHYVDVGKPDDPAQEEACWEGLIAIYRELIPVAERCGVGIGNHSLHRLLADGVRERAVASGVRIEEYGSYRTEGWGGPFLVGTWKELRRLVESVPSRANGVTLCTGMDIPGGDVLALIREFAGKIHFCQLRDHTARWPAGREVPPGEGTLDFPAIIAALRDAGYEGIVNPEHLGKPRYPGEDLLAKAVAYLAPLLA